MRCVRASTRRRPARSPKHARRRRRRPRKAASPRSAHSTQSPQHARPRGNSAPASMHQYGVRDVEKLLRLPRSTIRSLIEAGFVSPARGPRNSWLFSFQDLIVLRTAEALAAANVPRRRITRSVRELRRHLPESMPLSGLAISAVGDRVVVREGTNRWQAESGQYLLAFEGDPASDSLEVIERAEKSEPANDAHDWFEKGLALEEENIDAALHAYQQALEADSELLDAHLNRG